MTKGRNGQTYHNKVTKITAWYNHLISHRQPKDGLERDKKPLKDLEFFINQIKRPNEKG